MPLFVITLLVYVGAFLVVIVLGRAPWWTGSFGFLYSRNERLDAWLGRFFAPLYAVARRLGVQRLAQPFRRL